MKRKTKFVLWFATGILIGLFFLSSFIYIFFEKSYKGEIYPGVSIGGQNFSGQTKQQVFNFFEQKNSQFKNVNFTFIYQDQRVSVSAKTLKYGFNSQLLAEQAMSIGRTADLLTNLSLKLQAYFQGINLPVSYTFSQEELERTIAPLRQIIEIEPIDALFNFNNGRVVAFRPSSPGQAIDMEAFEKELSGYFPRLDNGTVEKTITITIPVVVKKPRVETADANNLGIKELLGIGSSKFIGSIPNRVYNIELAATRLNGLLVAPGEIFSFNNSVGDISKFTGYKEAYVIKDGKTILGDGGGVCQVSTTLFRAILNSGLPVVERHAHSYRVGYYEQDMGPGFDATVYAPSVDFKFKNDTKNHILIQAYTNTIDKTLAFALYGSGDNRKISVSKSIVTNQVPAPAPLYVDDPSLPRGVEKQIDFAAAGATTVFTRTVERNGEIFISDKFVSNFRPWQAVFLRGTKE
ncbi:VanW family protein [Candidatus Microgenomates bacterium]|nr:VanW family protein [Candidatus Microgenomates bacterium]